MQVSTDRVGPFVRRLPGGLLASQFWDMLLAFPALARHDRLPLPMCDMIIIMTCSATMI